MHLQDCTNETENKAQEKRAEIMNTFLGAISHFKQLLSTVEKDEAKVEYSKQMIIEIYKYCINIYLIFYTDICVWSIRFHLLCVKNVLPFVESK